MSEEIKNKAITSAQKELIMLNGSIMRLLSEFKSKHKNELQILEAEYEDSLYDHFVKLVKNVNETISDSFLAMNYGLSDKQSIKNLSKELTDYYNHNFTKSKAEPAELQGVEIERHTGTWYEVDSSTVGDDTYYLMESEQHGDEAACLIINSDHTLCCEDVWNGFDDEIFVEYLYKKHVEQQNKDHIEAVIEDYNLVINTLKHQNGEACAVINKNSADIIYIDFRRDNGELRFIHNDREISEEDCKLIVSNADTVEYLSPQEYHAQYLENDNSVEFQKGLCLSDWQAEIESRKVEKAMDACLNQPTTEITQEQEK